jgi:hypothetical protein
VQSPIRRSLVGRTISNERSFRKPGLVDQQTERSPNVPLRVPGTTSADYETPHQQVEIRPFRPAKRNDSGLQAGGQELPDEAFLNQAVICRPKQARNACVKKVQASHHAAEEPPDEPAKDSPSPACPLRVDYTSEDVLGAEDPRVHVPVVVSPDSDSARIDTDHAVGDGLACSRSSKNDHVSAPDFSTIVGNNVELVPGVEGRVHARPGVDKILEEIRHISEPCPSRSRIGRKG